MNTVGDLLRDADPVAHEAEIAAERVRARDAVVAAATRPEARSFPRRRVVAAAAVVAAMVVAAAAGSRLWPANATLHAAAVRFEVRLAEATPTLALQPVRVAGSNQTVYLHQDAVVTNDDIAAARVVPGSGPSQFHVAVRFTPDGAEKMRAATAAHVGRPIALMIDGQVVMAPTVRSPISTDAVVTGDFTQAEAERIAAGMLVR